MLPWLLIRSEFNPFMVPALPHLSYRCSSDLTLNGPSGNFVDYFAPYSPVYFVYAGSLDFQLYWKLNFESLPSLLGHPLSNNYILLSVKLGISSSLLFLINYDVSFNLIYFLLPTISPSSVPDSASLTVILYYLISCGLSRCFRFFILLSFIYLSLCTLPLLLLSFQPIS